MGPEAVLPEEAARRHMVVPLGIDASGVLVLGAYPGPESSRCAREVACRSGLPVRLIPLPEADVASAIDRAYGTTPPDPGRWRIPGGDPEAHDTARLIRSILDCGLALRVSDVHLEPQEGCLRVRYRRDGRLTDWTRLPAETAVPLIARVKVLCGLDTLLRDRPQEGRFTWQGEPGKVVHVRVSIIPGWQGEKAVLRILAANRGGFLPLDGLGLERHQLDFLRRLVLRPQGLILVAGPTGSGKTTTLNALVAEMDREARNVVTLEEPVEYVMPDITQIAVNPRAGVTFASGLRAVLRQDPDVIVIGEVRDPETALVAVQAALTGHLVLSAIHAPDATAALVRLLEAGVSPVMLAAAVTGVVAQRLVRRICPACRVPAAATTDETGFFLLHGGGTTSPFYRGQGCTVCEKTGYLGRTGIYETVAVGEEMKAALTTRDPAAIRDRAVSGGMVSLAGAACRKAAAGETTMAEVMAVVPL